MEKMLSKFLREDDGAVTVDWVVLTAAIVGLGIAVATVVGQGAMSHSTSLGNYVSAMSIASY
ncbi:Flp family type IVb pilin [Vannielia litorea]|uniref:Flp family type IVb pilin n=1 Tax=Vannielia litorea TaxID=1217970 RepID=UPI001BCB8F23|nr:hypothetical protein [Vannielia litorea]MBS8225920.1 hypothetical protein [Vannielia litorea]